MKRLLHACPLTDVNSSNVKTERFTREIRHVAHIVTYVAQRDNPVEDGAPDTDPAHELGVNGGLIDRDDVVDGVIEQRDQSRNADDCQWLSRKKTEHHCRQRRREKSFIDTVELSSSAVHIQRISYGRQHTGRRVSASVLFSGW